MRQQFDLYLPISTILRVFGALILAAVLMKLVPMIFLIFFAVLIAVTLVPMVDFLENKRFPPWLAKVLVSLILVAFVSFVAFVLVPAVIGQISSLFAKIPELQKSLENSIDSDLIRRKVHENFEDPKIIFDDAGKKIAALGSMAMAGAYQFLLLMILSIYLMIDGVRTYQWLVVYFSPTIQTKIKDTVTEIKPVIIAYIAGQVITCILIGIFIFVTHRALQVPGALMLAVLAMICDIVPVLGFIISISVATVLALTVSPNTALIVIALHISYMVFENNFLAPRIYGTRMKISSLAVLVSILAANMIAGIPGMVMILPVVASYPIIEKIWLKRYVSESTVQAHHKQLIASKTKSVE